MSIARVELNIMKAYSQASLIPPIERIDSISAEDFGGVDWVLVVEKDVSSNWQTI